MEQRRRIQQMEQILDRGEAALEALHRALETYRALEPELDRLEDYYAGPLWQKDFQDDQAGKLPPELKRGILSEDGIWNLLTDRQDIIREMRRIAGSGLED